MTHATQTVPSGAKSNQMCINQKTVLEASNLRRPRPSDDLGVHTEFEDILAPLSESDPPFQRKALHNLSISSVQPFDNGKDEA